MMRHGRWLLIHGSAAVLVILLARTIAYALAPSPAARLLEHRAGGPALPVLVLISLVLGASVAIAICWLAALGVRERSLLEQRLLAEPVPAFRAGRMLALGLGLSIATSIGGGLFEAYLHWRGGLGWHGVECIVGPVHRDLLPIETALSLVAAAALAAADHVVAWMRRTFALLRALSLRVAACASPAPPAAVHAARTVVRLSAGGPRAPPALS
jgi:hypothetical protein